MFGEEGTTGDQARCVAKTIASDRTGEGRNFVRMSNFVTQKAYATGSILSAK